MRVVILAPPGVQSIDVVGPMEVFWEADGRLGDPSAYDIQIMSTGEAMIHGTGRLRFAADRTIFDADEPIDTIPVAGDPSFQAVDQEAIGWLRRRAPEARRYGSICTGVYLLAEAGLLKGERVATHWECVERFSTEHPEVELDADAIFVRDGRLCTAAAVTAGIDLALALARRTTGMRWQ